MNPVFLERMKEDLKDEYDCFLETLDHPMYKGLRYNPLKIDIKQLKQAIPGLIKSPFCDEGYYIDHSMGNHPYHIAGAFYLQEPSASGAVQVLNVQPDDVVLDLCAAPGGKSTQIAASLKEGFLVCNEYDPKRCQTLNFNLERMGVENFALIQGDAGIVCEEFHDCFDKVLVDAPCSGEGMMKKHEAANMNWSLEHIHFCAKRQADILDQAYKALKKGGILVYSTCTYAREENEQTVAAFLQRHPDMIQLDPGVSFGRPGYPTPGLDASKVVRIYPMDHGEGHFICRLQKTQGKIRTLPRVKNHSSAQDQAHVEEHLKVLPAHMMKIKDKLYGMNHEFIDVKKSRLIRQGVFLGQDIKKRWEPAHALYMAYPKVNYMHSVELDLEQMDAMMHGLQIPLESPKGYVAVCFQGIPFGFAKSDGSRLNNKIPKGLRLLPSSHVG